MIDQNRGGQRRVRLVKCVFDNDGARPDEPELQAGDVFRSRKGIEYLVVTAARVKSKKHPSRWRVEMRKFKDGGAPLDPGRRVLHFGWKPRGQRGDKLIPELRRSAMQRGLFEGLPDEPPVL